MKKIKFFICIIIIFTSSCKTQYVGQGYIKCPTNNKSFFYLRHGFKPTKQFLKFGNL